MTSGIEDLLRIEAPQVLGALVRRFGRFDIAEDAVQEALLTAVQRWPADGVPADPRSWLIRIGYRRMVDLLRSDQARHRRELAAGATDLVMTEPQRAAAIPHVDDSLTLLMLCCHPALGHTSQVALTLLADLPATPMARHSEPTRDRLDRLRPRNFPGHQPPPDLAPGSARHPTRTHPR